MKCALRGSEMILNALRVALRIDSGIVFLICISAKPAGLAEMLFHGGAVMVKWRFQTANAVYLCAPTCEKSVWSTPQSATNAKY